jgi:hypothetical protein
MKAITLRAHFDGDHIQLDQPFALEPGTPLAVTVVPEAAEEPAWSALSAAGLEAAYGESEPEYPLELIKEPNPDYEGG